MLAVYLHPRREFSCKAGTIVLPIVTWETARPQIKIWMKAIKSGQLGKDRKSGQFMTLFKIPDNHPVALVVGGSGSGKQSLTYYPLSSMPAEDREILEHWFTNPTETPVHLNIDASHFVPELVLGSALGDNAIKWTKDIQLLYGKPGKKDER